LRHTTELNRFNTKNCTCTRMHACVPVMRRWSGWRTLPTGVKERLIRASWSAHRPFSPISHTNAPHEESGLISRRERRWDSQAPWPRGLSYLRNGSQDTRRTNSTFGGCTAPDDACAHLRTIGNAHREIYASGESK